MLPENLEITDEDIIFAEALLLPEGSSFDDERRDFIKNIATIDLQAVPGSGKTTALLAKLLILEKKREGQKWAILMLSHTNAAIDEIKRKIGHLCPKLFEYPNFVGTIQSFVDDFLAIPYYCNKYKKRPSVINSDLYFERLEKILAICFQGEDRDTYNKVFSIKMANESFIKNYRLGFNDHNEIILLKNINDTELEIKKPRRNTRNYVDYTSDEKRSVVKYLKKVKYQLLKEGVLHYDDAYFLAKCLLNKKPDFKVLLQRRFKFVFVDEMQDMDKHQVDLLEDIFYDNAQSLNVYQRIGDKNQAIHSNVNSDDAWGLRGTVDLKLAGSHRLTPEIANVVKNFGLDFIEIEGRRNSDILNLKPHIIFFTDPSTVLETFTRLIQEKQLLNFKGNDEYPFRAVGWTESNVNTDRFSIRSYCPSFKKNPSKTYRDYQFLRDYLNNSIIQKQVQTLEPIQDNLIKALLKSLEILGERNEVGSYYTKSLFLKFLKITDESEYRNFKAHLYNWSHLILRGSDVYQSVKDYFLLLINRLYPENDLTNVNLVNFLDGQTETQEQLDIQESNPNIHTSNGIDVKLGTIHSVKGETHVATLYLECFYEGKYESERLLPQLSGTQFSSDKKRHQQSLKMMYVGFSRPTHFLCFAVHSSRRFDVDLNLWEVIE